MPQLFIYTRTLISINYTIASNCINRGSWGSQRSGVTSADHCQSKVKPFKSFKNVKYNGRSVSMKDEKRAVIARFKMFDIVLVV